MVRESEIFYGFCKSFSSFGIKSSVTPSTWKYRIYFFFDSLGRMLGYDVFTEDTFRKNESSKALIGKRIDMTWVSPISKKYVLALEYENTRKIDDEIIKLAEIGGLRVLVIFRHAFTDEEVITKVRAAQERDSYIKSKFFVFVLPKYFQPHKPFERLKAWLFNSHGHVIGFGNAEGYLGSDGKCSFQRVCWVSKKAL